MAKPVFEISCEWDEQAGVWYVVESNVPGLAAEAASKEEMESLLAELVPELVQLNLPELYRHNVPSGQG